ncbi:hypothetical protein Ocin01_14494 [Orchesella cincta]|uniref:Uncharacterized protein n=1 Tax=Orchesella cincta TaxID=48709 RepID=A0A1D2MGT6_ORCCI|nr:hypothetical protein Ocin01_14494 [Orchesella cincta]
MLLQWAHAPSKHQMSWRRWRRRTLTELGSVPWFFLALSLVSSEVSGYHPHPHAAYPHHHHQSQQQPQYPHPSSQSPQLPAPIQVQAQYQNAPQYGQHQLTGPSAPGNMPPQGPPPPNNYYYQIESGNKLVQRQLSPNQQPQQAGLTAAATNFLVQQIELERAQQQQQRQFQSATPNIQAQTLQLLAGLSPQQLAALQGIMPRNNIAHAASSQQSVSVLPPPSQEGGQQGFSSRMGPFDKLFSKAKSWLPDMMSAGSSQSQKGIGEPKMRDLHRLPKPPTYPLYDLPGIGQATPPPAPIMHPMASLPSSAFDFDSAPSSISASSPRSTFNQQNWMSPSPTMSTSRRSRPSPRPPKPSKSSFLRNPLGRSHKKSRPSSEPPVNYNRRNHGPPPGGRQPPPPPPGPRNRNRNQSPNNKQQKKPSSSGGGRYPPPPRSRRPPSSGPTTDPYSSSGGGPPGPHMGYDHPMASNLSPAHSPALGRPLGYEEYMASPSHSYTDDPWNFDPFANQMNQGLHTGSLRYNYDPLGMNALDTEANSHLDPNKLSYPGDAFNQDMVKDSPGIGAQAQVGGWDKPYKKRPYNTDPETELTPPGQNSGYGATPPASNSFSSSPSDPYQTQSIPTSLGGRYKSKGNSESSSGSNSFNSENEGTGFLGDTLSGGRRGDFPMEMHDSESSIPSMRRGNENGERERERGRPRYEAIQAMQSHDDAPTIDLESLQTQQEEQEDGMSAMEFTIETSMDKDAARGGMEGAESAPPEPHILGPMQPAPNPYLSDQYNPYGEHSSPGGSSIPGIPYGPNGFRERYGRRRTRNNNQREAAAPSGQRKQRRRQKQQRVSEVPEGVQIFNDIIRPQLQSSSSSSRSKPNPNHAALRRSLYNAIRQSA